MYLIPNYVGTNVNRLTTGSSSRTMKTRSMAKKTSIPSKSSATSVPMETDDIVAPQRSTCAKGAPSRVTRSRVNEKDAHKAVRAVKIASSFPTAPQITQAPLPVPNNFSFNAPAGVESFSFSVDQFKFTQLSPKSAQRFSIIRTPSMELPSSNSGAVAGRGVERVVGEDTTVEMHDMNGGTNTEVLDSKYFRNLANDEIDRLQSRCAKWENEEDKMIAEEGTV